MRPFVVVHNAVSVNGMLTGFDVDMGVYYGLAADLECQATLVGAGTVLAAPEALSADDPLDAGPSDPGAGSILVIPDSRGRVRCWGALQRSGLWDRFVSLVSDATPAEHIAYLERRGVGVIGAGPDHVDLASALGMLGERYGVTRVRTDTGGTLVGVMLEEGLVDEISLVVCPVVVGAGEVPLVRGTLERTALRLTHEERFSGGEVWLRYQVETR